MTFDAITNSTTQTGTTYPKNGHGRVGEIAIDGVGTTAPELVFVIYGVSARVCNACNKKQGVTTNYDSTTTSTSIGESSGNSSPENFVGFTSTHSFGTGATDFAGKKSFCAPATDDSAPSRLGIWHVLKAR